MNVERHTSANKAPWPVVTEESLANKRIDGEQIKVRCIAPEGIYYGPDYQRKREGDVFMLKPLMVTALHKDGPQKGSPIIENGKPKMVLVTAMEQFSEKTMELVDDPAAPVHATTAQEHVDRQTNAMRRQGKRGEE
jgi:hypothetical protein